MIFFLFHKIKDFVIFHLNPKENVKSEIDISRPICFTKIIILLIYLYSEITVFYFVKIKCEMPCENRTYYIVL